MKEDAEFKKIPLWNWLTGRMCWETKSGFLLILAGGTILWFTGATLSYAFLIVGAVIQAAGLFRDCKIVYKCRRKI